ncbi:MAG TPA: RHS repeat-associated core domain-containing protein [Verrucomicrobiota bacterium]|jgi:RHS repeat-associated protein|nr:hypothetical protein [Verrucomicrobiota bacterium]OQB90070.1 MAG: tRNA(Glu)-specific nuclease WapA precursor [Verrucomicrobia bacterium ADurb.Bin118]HPY31861.1 RHS repeat-associated core domain-containing protein [Verrucomicrobiota bacterium]HQB17596.1 RHS repeat-associated core domain-containing protein [Verrucomicrobiota bacterium]
MTTVKRYDALNRLTSITNEPSGAGAIGSRYVYNEANQRTAVTNADTSRWVYTYDKLGQVISGKKYWSDNTPVAGQQFEYGFDDIGNRKSTAAGGDALGMNLRYAGYTNNSLNQIAGRSVPGYVNMIGSASNAATVTLWGDNGAFSATSRKGAYFRGELAVTNTANPVWLTITNTAVLNNGGNPDIVTNAVGQTYVAKTPEVFSYDLDGNLTNDGRWVYTWDAENRLVKQESLSGAPTASKRKVVWEFDGKGRRVRQTTYNGSSGSYVATEDLKFLADGWRHLAELNATNNALVRSYVWGLDLSGTLAGAGGVGGLLWVTVGPAVPSGPGTHYCAYDGNGNVAALSAASDGSESARYEYGPFGELIRATGPMALENPFRFSTKRTDNTTDFVLYEYRLYSPSTGRWPNRDPLLSDEAFHPTGLSPEALLGAVAYEGPNLYGFVRQNPVNGVDHLGLFSIPDATDWVVNHSLCLASTLGIGKCCAERFTASLPVQKYDAGVVGLEFKFEWRTQVQKCRECCSGGGQGDRVTISSDLRGTMDLKVQLGVIPTPVPIVIRAYGGGSIGGALVTRINTCTGINKTSGCTFVAARFGAEGCATLGVGEVCLRAEGAYTHRNCKDPDLSTDCLAGRAMLRFKVLWRSYDFIFWQTAPCATN